MRGALAAALLLAGCGDVNDAQETARIRAGTAAVRGVLKEPQTAQFRGVEAHPDGAVCGEVNASVGMGRTGYERFIVAGGKVTLASQLKTDVEMDARWANDCR